MPPEAMREIRWPWVLNSDTAPACKAHEPLEHYTSLLKLRQLRVAMRNRICADRADSHARYTQFACVSAEASSPHPGSDSHPS